MVQPATTDREVGRISVAGVVFLENPQKQGQGIICVQHCDETIST